ncbi:hypothetical protein H310_05502 [Aphanomyces invadans]|uniref:Pentacotripeptide-repeat region of PRORP domain-containing protein n=1 Tax=Aphanomyces invadans TaxID=157072 RepID=A0A024U9X0_9STRA|nr:hypothetical protein H310_05502 [Aphanomyces invadans]ETW03074.1 hypothetical protein H310_05502 [Aphanomyces invadans]|eukprot:XP_008868458.1 hypothetical protein H310_05502 [Aphanomyces invadans]
MKAISAGRAARTATALAHAQTMLKKLRLKQVALKQDEFDKLVATAGRTLNSSSAKEVLEFMESQEYPKVAPTTRTYNTVLKSLSREGRHASVVSVFQHMDTLNLVDTRSYDIALDSCGWHGDVARARLLLFDMDRRGIPRSTASYQGAIHACIQSHNISQALRFWDRMINTDGLHPTVHAYTQLLSVLSPNNRGGRSSTVDHSTLVTHFNEAFGTYGLQPTRKMALLVLNALPVECIFPWLESLKERNLAVRMDGAIYVAAMNKADLAGKVDVVVDCLSLYFQRRQSKLEHVLPLLRGLHLTPRGVDAVVSHVWSTFHEISPHTPTFNVLLTMLGRANFKANVLSTMETMVLASHADHHSFRIALTYCAVQDRLTVLSWLESYELPPTITDSVVAWNSALHACCLRGQMDLAELIFEYMPVLPNAASYGILFKGYAKQPFTPALAAVVRQHYHSMCQEQLTPTTSGLFCFVQCLRPRDVLPFLDALFRAAKTQPVSRDVCHSALDVCRVHALWEDAIAIAGLMTRHNVVPTHETHSVVLLACANAGQFDAAMTYLHSSVAGDAAATTSARSPNAVSHKYATATITDVFNAAIEVCAKTKHVDEATALYEGLQKMGLTPTSTTVTRYIKLLASTGDIAAARQLLLDWHTSSTELEMDIAPYNALLSACCAQRDVDMAFTILEDLQGRTSRAGGGPGTKWRATTTDSWIVTPDIYTYGHLLHALLQSDARCVDDMQRLLQDLIGQGIELSVVPFTLVMIKCLKKGVPRTALDVYDSMLIQHNVLPDHVAFLVYVDAWKHCLETPTQASNAPIELSVVTRRLLDSKWGLLHATDKDEAPVLVLRVLQLFHVLWTQRDLNLVDDARSFLDMVATMEDDENELPCSTKKTKLLLGDSYAVVMRLLNEAGRAAESISLVGEMKARSTPLSVDCYVEWMVALEEAERWPESTDVFMEMRRSCGPTSASVDQLSRTYMGRQFLRSNSVSTLGKDAQNFKTK